MPGNTDFYAFDKKRAPVNVKYKPKEKESMTNLSDIITEAIYLP